MGKDVGIAVEFVGGLDLDRYSSLLNLVKCLGTDEVGLVPITEETGRYLVHAMRG